MNSRQVLTAILLLSLISGDYSQSLIQMKPEHRHHSGNFDIFSGNRKIRLRDNESYCESWKFSVEANNAGKWTVPEMCCSFVIVYMNGDRYKSDSKVVAEHSIAFAKTMELAGDGKDAWVFDIDETLLTNLKKYNRCATNTSGSETVALPASLRLYKELQELNFTIFIISRRKENTRNATIQQLETAGYSNFKNLILRQPADHGKKAIVYKSERREELQDEGYRILGNSGDQWSDLMGSAIANWSFKLPNPMYYTG